MHGAGLRTWDPIRATRPTAPGQPRLAQTCWTLLVPSGAIGRLVLRTSLHLQWVTSHSVLAGPQGSLL